MPDPKPEPLVKWPEEIKQLTFADLEVNELFVFAEGNDEFVRQKTGDETFTTLSLGGTRAKLGYVQANPGRPVRRLKMIRSPQFEVI